MSRATKIVLIALIVLVAGVAFWLPSAINSTQQVLDNEKKEATSTSNMMLVLFSSGWDVPSLALQTNAKFDQDSKRTQALFDKCRKELGPLVSGEMGATDIRFDDTDLSKPTLVAVVRGNVKYAKGMAIVTMTLRREPKNAWLLESLAIEPVTTRASSQRNSP